MGFLDFIKKKVDEVIEDVTDKVEAATAPTPAPSANSIGKINLRKEQVGICLSKKKMDGVKARVCLVMDDSGSMHHLYKNGTVQETIERILPVALKLDDNGELDMWLFDDHFKRLDSIGEADFENYTDRVVMRHATWGGTSYSRVMNDIVKKYVLEEPDALPVFVIFITDGECFDANAARQEIKDASKHGIFWQFVGIGSEDFKFLNELDTMGGRLVDNANFLQIENINKVSDESLYDMLLNEYPSWEKEAKNKGIIR